MGVRLRGARREAVAGPRAGEMLASARRWSAAARAAVAPGGSSDAHIQAFVDEVARRAQGQRPPAVET